MEIIYSKHIIDERQFKLNELYGLVDRNSTFIKKQFVGLKTFNYKSNKRVKSILFLSKCRNKELTEKLYNDFELNIEIEKKRMKDLSTSELVKVLTICICTYKKVNLIVLDHIDTCLNYGDLNTILKSLKQCMKMINKVILFSTSKVDNILNTCSEYVVAGENRIIYNGNKFVELPVKPEIVEFVDLANKRGANMSYYKETYDLLKAIYRSVKKRNIL